MAFNPAIMNSPGPLSSFLGNYQQAKQQQEVKNLMPGAMSGDPDSLTQLMTVSPQTGIQVSGIVQQRAIQQRALNQQLQTQKYAGAAIQGDPDALANLMQVNPGVGLNVKKQLDLAKFQNGKVGAEGIRLTDIADPNAPGQNQKIQVLPDGTTKVIGRSATPPAKPNDGTWVGGSGVNPATGKVEDYSRNNKTNEIKWLGMPAAPKGGVQAQDTSFLDSITQNTTPEELAKLSPQQKAIKQYWDSVGNYDAAPLAGNVAGKPENKEGVAYMARMYPDHKASNYSNLQKMDAMWNVGKRSDDIASFDKTISHINDLRGLASNLKNNDTQWGNKIGNAVANQFGDPSVNSYEAAAPLVADELVRTMVGAGGTLTDRENAQVKALGAAKSPEQFKQSLDAVVSLLGGKLNALKQQHDTGYAHLGKKNIPDFNSRLGQEGQDALKEYQTSHGQQDSKKDNTSSHPEANQALKWAKDHPDDPRSKAILSKLGQ